MVRKDKAAYTMMQIKKHTRDRLADFKVVQMESFDDVIIRLMDSVNQKDLISNLADELERRKVFVRLRHPEKGLKKK